MDAKGHDFGVKLFSSLSNNIRQSKDKVSWENDNPTMFTGARLFCLEFVGVTCEGSSILSWPILFLLLKCTALLGIATYAYLSAILPIFVDAWSWWGL